jgi:ABC-type cobalamin/Fe3+-siderophores transport system ATPase subunit
VSDYVIEASAIHLKIGSKKLLNHVDIKVAKGQLIALVGPNGAGKTSLLKLLSGLKPADSGTINICGKPINDWSAAELSELIAYLPQRSEVYWNYSVADILELNQRRFSTAPLTTINNNHSPSILSSVFQQEFELEYMMDQCFKTLSGGEQARVLLAASLISNPEILLADEPTASLDVAHQLSLLKRIKSRTQRGLTAVIVMHDLNLAARFADRIIVMTQGTTQMDGITADVMLSGDLDQHFGVSFHRIEVDQRFVLVPDFVPLMPSNKKTVMPLLEAG